MVAQTVYIGSVGYVDYERGPDPINVMYLGVHKRRSFEHEREL